MSPHAARFAQFPEVGEYLTYLNANALEGWSMQGPNLYIPKATIQSYFQQRGRLETLLQRVLDPKEFDDVDCEYVFKHHLVGLTILLWIDRPNFLPSLVRARLSDERLPFDVAPSNFPPLANGSFFQEFRDAQWRFCPFVFRIGEKDCRIEPERIIPVRSKRQLRRRPPATVWKVVLHEDCDPFQAAHSPTYKAQCSSNTYIFKQFTGAHATSSYKKELKAFVHIYRYHKAQLGSTIIGFHGSFVHGDVPVIVLEYAEYGSLEDFYRTIEPPQDGHAIIHLWRAVLQLCSGLCAIHNISPVNQDDERFHSVLRGWHQDIKPGNILVTRGVSGVGDGYSFRLADLGTTHFTRMPDATDEELRDADAGGTKAYGAPECYRSNHLAEEMTLRIGQNVDIWSLGAVLSEFAVWLVCGLVELNKYRLTREAATESLADPGCFHDGHGQLLPCVREFNKRAIDNRRMGDRITKKVLQQLIDGMLFVESTARPSAQYLVQKSGDILDTAQTNLIQQQNSSPAAHNSPHEQQQYHNGHQSLPILSLPSPIETSPSLNGMHSSPPELTPTDAFMNGSSDLGVELEGPVTPTPLSNKRRPVHIQVTESNGHSTRNHSPCSRDQTQANSRKERILSPDGSINGVTDPEDQKPEHASTYPSTPDASEHDEVDDPLPIESGPVTPGPNVSTSSAPGLTLGSLATYRQHMKSGSSKHATLSGGDCLAPLAEPARDFVFLVDDSASMREHKHRIIKAVESLSWLLKRYDDDGIDIYFMRSKQKAHARRKSSSDLIAPLVTAMADASGTSDVTLRLESLLHEYCEDYKRTQDLPRTTSGLGLSRFMTGRRAQQRIKPRMIYIFTNAIWQEASDPTSIIKEAASRLDDMHAPQYQLGIQFISVGASRENQRKLDRLDRGLGLPRDMVDTEPISGNVYKMLLGPVDRKWDGDYSSG